MTARGHHADAGSACATRRAAQAHRTRGRRLRLSRPALAAGLAHRARPHPAAACRRPRGAAPCGHPLADRDAARCKWAALQIPPIVAVASPCAAGVDGVVAAARELQRAGADALLMDGIGCADTHRAVVAGATGLTACCRAIWWRVSPAPASTGRHDARAARRRSAGRRWGIIPGSSACDLPFVVSSVVSSPAVVPRWP